MNFWNWHLCRHVNWSLEVVNKMICHRCKELNPGAVQTTNKSSVWATVEPSFPSVWGQTHPQTAAIKPSHQLRPYHCWGMAQSCIYLLKMIDFSSPPYPRSAQFPCLLYHLLYFSQAGCDIPWHIKINQSCSIRQQPRKNGRMCDLTTCSAVYFCCLPSEHGDSTFLPFPTIWSYRRQLARTLHFHFYCVGSQTLMQIVCRTSSLHGVWGFFWFSSSTSFHAACSSVRLAPASSHCSHCYFHVKGVRGIFFFARTAI